MLLTPNILRASIRLFSPVAFRVPKRSYKHWPETISKNDSFMPAKQEDRQLPSVLHTPVNYPAGVVAPMKHPKANDDMRGPERIHNQLKYGQYGIIALGGGAFSGAHFDMIRDRINKYLDTERFFAVWRIDPPWKAKSKKSQGKKMGGGKAKVHHYETPIKAGRVLIEIAGRGEFGEVEPLLKNICQRLPIYAMPISQEVMDELKREKQKLDAENYNPFEYRTLLRKNFSNSSQYISPKELIWGGTYF